MKVKVKKLHEDAVIPSYATEGDACFDLVAVSKKITSQYIQYGTGLAFEIPKGHVGMIYPRSSVTKKDLTLKNSVGIIDSGYRGEVSFRFNVVGRSTVTEYDERTEYRADIYEVGERVGQMMIVPIPTIELEEVDDLSDSERGEGGYGSTGV